jgi:PAS domain S-box-containing protein
MVKLRRVTVPRNQSSDASRRSVRTTESGLKAFLEAKTDCHWFWNIDSDEIQFSTDLPVPRGYSDSKVSKKKTFITGILHPDEQGEFESRLESLRAGTSEELDFEYRLQVNNEQFKWFRIRGKVVETNKLGLPLACAGTILDIHAQKLAQEELAKSQALLSAIFQASDDCIWVVDPEDFRLLAFNDADEDFLLRAYGVHASVGMRAEDLIPEMPERWNQFYRDVLNHGEFNSDQYVRETGQTFHVVARLLVRDDGSAFGIVAFAHDVTDRKRIEKTLRESEERFSKVFSHSPLAIMVTSVIDDRYLEVNEAFERATGYKRDEVIGKRPIDIGLWVSPELRVKMKENLVANGYARVDIAFRTKAGDERVAIGSASLIDIDGEPCVLAMATDVTDRKRAEEALAESEERLQIAIGSGRMYAFERDFETDVAKRSGQYASILGIDEDDLKQRRAELLVRMHPADKDHYQDAIRSLSPEKSSYKVAFRLNRPDQEMIWLEESGRGFFDSNGKLRKIVGMTSDVTDARRSENMLRELSGRLISAQEEERSHIARELHDHIGQQLALLCVRAQSLDAGVSDHDHAMHADMHELYRKIKEIALNVSQLSHQLHSSELTFLGLRAAADRLCRDFASLHSIDIDYQFRDVPDLDPKKSLCFYRIVQESLQNVAKHSHATRVMVEMLRRGNELSLKIVDNGVGFDPDKILHTSGLGLVSIRERLRSIDGNLKIISGEGRGTCLIATVAIGSRDSNLESQESASG